MNGANRHANEERRSGNVLVLRTRSASAPATSPSTAPTPVERIAADRVRFPLPSPSSSRLTNGDKSAAAAAAATIRENHEAAENHAATPLPAPGVVLFPADRVRLGWRYENMSVVGSGLTNSGTVCYINATLQALFHTPAFVNWLMDDKQHRSACRRRKTHYNCVVCMVRHTFKSTRKHTGRSTNADKICRNLSLICQGLSIHRQEDAHEFLRYLVQSLERDYVSSLGYYPVNLDSRSKETVPTGQIFGSYVKSEVTCIGCAHVSTSFEYQQDITLDIDRFDAVADALDEYFKAERLEGYHCQTCARQVVAEKRYSVEKPPNVLCVQLKRYKYETYCGSSSVGSKNNKTVRVDERLNLSAHRGSKSNAQQPPPPPLTYRLTSMINHHGTSLNCGHYTAVGLTPFGSYYNFDDVNVTPTDFRSHTASDNAYILFYELEPPSASSNTDDHAAESVNDCKPCPTPCATAASVRSRKRSRPNDFSSNDEIERFNGASSRPVSYDVGMVVDIDEQRASDKADTNMSPNAKIPRKTMSAPIDWSVWLREWDLVQTVNRHGHREDDSVLMSNGNNSTEIDEKLTFRFVCDDDDDDDGDKEKGIKRLFDDVGDDDNDVLLLERNPPKRNKCSSMPH